MNYYYNYYNNCIIIIQYNNYNNYNYYIMNFFINGILFREYKIIF